MVKQFSFWDEKIDRSKLGGFVYALVDPEDKSIFYIGKGGGSGSKGNERPNQHLIEAFDYRTHPQKWKKRGDISKVKRINDIWDREKNNLVELVILRRRMDAETTTHLEAALIQSIKYFSGEKLTNIVEGFRNSSNGLIDNNNAVTLYAEQLKPFEGDVILWIFPIKNGLKSKSAFEATVASWRVSPKNLNMMGYAIGIDENRICRSVIKMNNWVQDLEIPNKWKIDGQDISQDEGSHFFEKDFEKILTKDYSQTLKKANAKNHSLGFWLNGNYMIVRIKGNEVHYLHGNKSYSSISI